MQQMMFLVMTESVMFGAPMTGLVWSGRLWRKHWHATVVVEMVLLVAGEMGTEETLHPWSWESASPC